MMVLLEPDQIAGAITDDGTRDSAQAGQHQFTSLAVGDGRFTSRTDHFGDEIAFQHVHSAERETFASDRTRLGQTITIEALRAPRLLELRTVVSRAGSRADDFADAEVIRTDPGSFSSLAQAHQLSRPGNEDSWAEGTKHFQQLVRSQVARGKTSATETTRALVHNRRPGRSSERQREYDSISGFDACDEEKRHAAMHDPTPALQRVRPEHRGAGRAGRIMEAPAGGERTGEVRAKRRSGILVCHQLGAGCERKLDQFIQRTELMKMHAGLAPLVSVEWVPFPNLVQQMVEFAELEHFEIGRGH